jgi:DNA (cytosine-5)-methyltransferase 1
MKTKSRSFTAVDLFAGCGGLSLGLEESGFEPVFVSELHPDAMSTYVSNRPKSEIQKNHNRVNDIYDLTSKKSNLETLVSRLNSQYGEIDLVAGGPPCQGFSGIGIRRTFNLSKEEIPTNHLYKEMAKVIKFLAPKVFLFENVRGLLTSRWTPQGEKGEIWKDVQETFGNILVKKNGRILQYKIGYELVYAKEFGVPQNRPRIIMIGVREDIPDNLGNDFGENNLNLKRELSYPHPKELLSDLIDGSWYPGGASKKYLRGPQNSIQKKLRTHHLTGQILPKGSALIDQEYSKHSEKVIEKFQFMIENEGRIPASLKTKKFAQRLLPELWDVTGPNITATSLPDDYVHFSQPRVLTVREWARLQTFPDSYLFIGKRTTGGRRRAGDPMSGNWSRDLPKYTQIGNAVPVELARILGNHVRERILGD